MRTFLLAAAVLAWGSGVRADEPQGSAALIDELLERAWNAQSISPAPASGDAEFLRRVSLDVAGTPPSAPEIVEFLADRRPDKRSLKVEELLARPEYAHHWATYWEKVLIGYDAQARTTSKRALYYWLRDEVLAKNLPYDRMCGALLTARGVSTEQPPVNFLLAQTRNNGGAIGITAKVSRTFLGTQIQCAQCHDHPFDRYTQEDFHGMVAFFVRVKNKKVDGQDPKDSRYELYDNPKGEASYGEGKARKTVPPLFLDGTAPDGAKERRDEFARLLLRPENLQFARALVNRYWAHFFGRGFVNPIDDFSGRTRPSQPELLEALTKEFVARKFDLRWLVRSIAGSRAYQLSSLKPRDPPSDRLFAYALTRPLSPEQLHAALSRAVGGESVSPTRSPKDEGQKSVQAQDNLLTQLRRMFSDAESIETSEFEGTIPQALLLMNGPAVNQGLAGKNGRVAQILKESAAPPERLERIFLWVLSRPPRDSERANFLAFLESSRQAPAAYEDVSWVLLNSSEFLFNH